ncbi:MAG TPA: nuclear transport factor 2 family protein [Pyrinomonadaceae bacterium]|jgi:hypothetical protein
MKHLALRLCVALATFAAGTTVGKLLSPLPFTAKPTTQAEQEVLSVERAYLDAHLNRDAAALARLLADDFTFQMSYGYTEGKSERLALVSDPGFAFTAIDTRDVTVSVVGYRATVTGRARVHVMREPAEFGPGSFAGDYSRTSPWYNYTRTFERRDGRWQIVSVHTTRLGCR